MAPGTGAYLIVSEVSQVPRSIGGGAELVGSISGHAVDAMSPTGTDGSVIAMTFRFGSLTCSIGHGAPTATRCPTYRPIPENRLAPTRNLDEPVQVTLRTQPHDSCSAAYLVDPCYRAEIEFKAPYAVTNASSEYAVQAKSSCSHARASSWSFTDDVEKGQTIRTESPGLFNCTSGDFQVEYLKYPRQQPPGGGGGDRHRELTCAREPLAQRLSREVPLTTDYARETSAEPARRFPRAHKGRVAAR